MHILGKKNLKKNGGPKKTAIGGSKNESKA
jgi:hypothetical protein